MAGYSSASLQKKLGIKPDMSWSAPSAPDGFGADFEEKASKVPTDITEDVWRDMILPTGWVDIKVCAIDDTWSGLKFVLRKELRP